MTIEFQIAVKLRFVDQQRNAYRDTLNVRTTSLISKWPGCNYFTCSLIYSSANSFTVRTYNKQQQFTAHAGNIGYHWKASRTPPQHTKCRFTLPALRCCAMQCYASRRFMSICCRKTERWSYFYSSLQIETRLPIMPCAYNLEPLFLKRKHWIGYYYLI